MGMLRDAEQQFRSALKHDQFVDIYLYLGKVYIRLDQPLNAVDIYEKGLEKFPDDASLLTGIARINEVCFHGPKVRFFRQNCIVS